MNIEKKIYTTQSLKHLKRRGELLMKELNRSIAAVDGLQQRKAESERLVTEWLDEEKRENLDTDMLDRELASLKVLVGEIDGETRRAKNITAEIGDINLELSKYC